MSVLKHKENGEWKVVNAVADIKKGDTDPTTSTPATTTGTFYMNTVTGDMFVLFSISGSTYTWRKLENSGNKVTSITSSSTDTQYPSAKAVYDLVTSMITNAMGGSY